tara:strand:- start:350 stop:541 length:192 start_codon:yes stop_codon:yes gene_type:complete
MSKAKIEYKFPCGYEFKVDVVNLPPLFCKSIILSCKLDGILDECPLHGKKCVKQQIVGRLKND